MNFYDSQENEIRLPFCRSFSIFWNMFMVFAPKFFIHWRGVRDDLQSFILLSKVMQHNTNIKPGIFNNLMRKRSLRDIH